LPLVREPPLWSSPASGLIEGDILDPVPPQPGSNRLD
jgi:hypothetical protein